MVNLSRSREELPDDDDDLYSYFNKSVSAVQAHADHFEQEYARPALRTSQAFFEGRPIITAFVAIFAFLSVVPVATFLGFSLFAIASFVIVALTSTVIACATVVLILLSFLALALLVTLVSSTFLTIFGVSLYSAACLLNLLRAHGYGGVSIWIDHMSKFLFGTFPPQLGSPIVNENGAEWPAFEDSQRETDVEIKHEELDTPYFTHESSPHESETAAKN